MTLRARFGGVSQATCRHLVGLVVVLTVALVSVGVAHATGTTPSPQPLWNAYPLNAGRSQSQHAPAGANTPTTRSAPRRSSVLRIALEVAAGLAAFGAAAAAFFVFLRMRRRRLTEGVSRREPYASAAAGRPRPQEPVTRRPVLRPRTREIVWDLLGTLDENKQEPAAPPSDDELLLVLCERVRSATLAGDVEWFRTAAAEFRWERAVGSLAIRSVDGDSPPYELAVNDWDGVELDTIRSTWSSRPDTAVPMDALAGVYEAARESASRIYEPIDTLIHALRRRAQRA